MFDWFFTRYSLKYGGHFISEFNPLHANFASSPIVFIIVSCLISWVSVYYQKNQSKISSLFFNLSLGLPIVIYLFAFFNHIVNLTKKPDIENYLKVNAGVVGALKVK